MSTTSINPSIGVIVKKNHQFKKIKILHSRRCVLYGKPSRMAM